MQLLWLDAGKIKEVALAEREQRSAPTIALQRGQHHCSIGKSADASGQIDHATGIGREAGDDRSADRRPDRELQAGGKVVDGDLAVADEHHLVGAVNGQAGVAGETDRIAGGAVHDVGPAAEGDGVFSAVEGDGVVAVADRDVSVAGCGTAERV